MITRRTALASLPFLMAAGHGFAQTVPDAAPRPVPTPPTSLDKLLAEADRLGALKAVLVSRNGDMVAERAYHGYPIDGSTNIKSASKSIVSALVGIPSTSGCWKGLTRRSRRSSRRNYRRDRTRASTT